MQVYFKSIDNLELIVRDLILTATMSIDIASYLPPSGEVLNALTDAKSRGVRLYGVFDGKIWHSSKDNQVGDIFYHPKFIFSPNMHQKILIIDKRIVVTGSYNFHAYNSYDTIMVINDQNVIYKFIDEFNRLYNAHEGTQSNSSSDGRVFDAGASSIIDRCKNKLATNSYSKTVLGIIEFYSQRKYLTNKQIDTLTGYLRGY